MHCHACVGVCVGDHGDLAVCMATGSITICSACDHGDLAVCMTMEGVVLSKGLGSCVNVHIHTALSSNL